MADEDIAKAPEVNSIVQEAKERYECAKEAYSITRKQAIDDTRFAMGDSDNLWQWPSDVSTQRKGDRRVCLTINLTAQHCGQIINNIRAQRPSGKVLPVDDMADKKTAEILSGLVRNIQASSNADEAHDIAAEHSVYGGEGYWYITTEYENETSFNQVIKIKPCTNPQLVYIDPDAIEPDKSDAEWGFIFEDVKKSTFEREYPDIKNVSSWDTDGEKQWVTKDTIRVALYFFCEYVPDNALLLSDGSSVLESDLLDDIERDGDTLKKPDGSSITIVKERKTTRKKWKRCTIAGNHDEPIDLEDWAGSYLPIVSVVGKELNVNGEIIRKGLVRDLKDPARMVNYSYSETVQTLAMQNKVPYMAAAEAIEGYESQWGGANIENLAYLPFNAYDDDGNALPMPSRQPPPVMPAAQIQLLQISTEEMRAASGQQNANFGIRSEASSGIGIQRLKQQGEIATFHFPDNLARALRYEIKIILDLIQQIYDTKRVVRVLGLDGKQDYATLDPSHPIPYAENRISDNDIKKIFNPTLGTYDVTIDTGPSFQTQRQEGYAAMMDLAGKDPQVLQIGGDIIMRNADYPGSDELADRFAKMLPPQLQDNKQGGPEQQLAQVTQQAQQMGMQLQQLHQAYQETQAKLQQAESGLQKTQLEIQAKLQLAQIDASIAERKAQIEQQAKLELAALEAHIEEQKQMRELAAKLRSDEIAAAAKIEESHHSACAEMAKTQMEIESREDIAELNAYVELEKAGMQNQALAEDVNEDLQKNETEAQIIVDKV